MTDPIEIPLRPLTAEGFAPFGQIVGGVPGTPPAFAAPQLESWRLDFDVDGPVELMLIRYAHRRPFEFTALERHLNVTQTFVPLGGAPSIMVVAPPTDPDDREGAPDPAAVRAFHVPGDRGLMLWRGTWHALTRFHVHPPGAAFAFLTGRDTQRELERQRADGTPPELTRVVDYRERRGIGFRVVDPDGLLDAAA